MQKNNNFYDTRCSNLVMGEKITSKNEITTTILINYSLKT